MSPDTALGAVLRNLRSARGLTLAAVARRVGCAESQLSHVERGRRRLQPDLADRLDEVYGSGGMIGSLVRHPATPGDVAGQAPAAEPPVLHVQVPGRKGETPMSIPRRDLIRILGVGFTSTPAFAQLARAVGSVPDDEELLWNLSHEFGHYQLAARSVAPAQVMDAMIGRTAVLDVGRIAPPNGLSGVAGTL